MSSADLVIKNGKVAFASSLRSCAIAAKGGRVTWLGSNSNIPKARRVVDASGLVVLPGVIDAHVHMRDPGATYKEDFRSGTAAAAAGGVTTILDMPNNVNPTSGVRALQEKERSAEEKAIVDYGFYGLLSEKVKDIRPLIRAGVIGFKWYMARTTGIPAPPSEERVREAMTSIGEAGRRVSVHAEDDSLVAARTARLRMAGRTDALAHYESRPEIVEDRAVRKAVRLAEETGCDLHIAHLSSSAGTDTVRKSKRRLGPRLTSETCPQYLLLDKNDYSSKGPLMKVNPSVKRREDKAALWRAVKDGTIDMITTDHAPHSLAEKSEGESIFDKASGFPGLETSVALMLTCVNNGLLPLSRYVQLTSEAPAKAWGLYPRKGSISQGADADFTLVDTRKEWKIDPEKFVSKAKYSPFEGFEVRGAAVYTIVRGHIVMDHGNVDSHFKGERQRPLATLQK